MIEHYSKYSTLAQTYVYCKNAFPSRTQVNTTKKTTKATKQTGTKILVRNIPFQANQNEIQEIFQYVFIFFFLHKVPFFTPYAFYRAFGELRSVRLPKKMALDEISHRGFGFVDYYSESDAKVKVFI